MFVSGSTNLLTSISGVLQRRPGFADPLEPTPTVFNNLQRLFTWDRFDGTFIGMACDVNASNFAQVFKRVIGVDASFVSIFTDTVANVFDFVVSNNTVYFSNGHVAKKWDPVNGVSNWGIAIGSVNNITGPTITGAGSNGSGSGINWTNPNNVTSAASYATVSTTASSSSNPLVANTFGFSIPAANTILGIQITYDLQFSESGLIRTGSLSAQLLKNGNPIGNLEFNQPLIPGTYSALTFGGTADLWGTGWTSNDINQTTWGVQFVAGLDSHTNTYSVKNVKATIYSLGGPPATVSGSAGTFSAVTGYEYVFCYGNTNTGHISSPTPASTSTGVFTNKLNVSVTLTASLDPQVNQIRLFRTTDSAAVGTTGGTFFELPTSPYANTSGAVTDNAADTTLNTFSIAPIPGFNDPPTPMLGMRYFSGRIWGFNNNKVYFSGLEEIPNGVPEESFVSGVAGNFWTFDQPCQALGVAGSVDNQRLAIFCGGRLYAITGNTLDTFRRFLVSNRRGCRSRTCVSELGGMLAWIDSSLQVWATNGTDLKELGLDIRPTLVSNIPASFTNVAITFHAAGSAHWLVCSFAGTILVYDIDTEQWMPPWTANLQYVFSGETAPGNYVLMGATTTKALALNTGKFNDNGSTYQPIIRTNLFSMVPDYGKRFNYIGTGSYDQPSRTGVPWTVQIDNNGLAITDVGLLTDDDPTVASPAYQSIASGLKDTVIAFNRKNGTNLVQNVYETNGPSARWASLQIKLANADQQDKLYNYWIAYKELGGR